MESSIDVPCQQVVEMSVNALQEDENDYEDVRETEDDSMYGNTLASSTSELYGDYQKLLEINEKLLTKSLKKEDIDDFENLFNNLRKKPNLALLGQSGSGKSTLINEIIKQPVLETSDGRGAVTQYPVELIYGGNTNFKLTENINLEKHELKSILTDKRYISKYYEELEEDRDLLEQIHSHINTMNEWSIPYNKKKKIFIWSKFNKKINGNENNKYHFEYKRKINDDDVSIWVNISPFVKKMSIYLNNDLLKNITLVDLPGLYDKSEVRVRKTKEYLENETDFIMIVESNERAATSQFIDKSLNSYIAKIIVTKQIPDILLTLTKVDRTYESSIKEITKEIDEEEDSYDEDEDYDDEDDDEKTFKNRVYSDFWKKLKFTEDKISEDIKSNNSLKNHHITSKDINIIFYSSEKMDVFNQVFEENIDLSVCNVKNNIVKICDCRTTRYKKIITNLIKNHYNDIKTYVNKETIQEEELNKIKNIISDIKNEIINKVDTEINHRELLVNGDDFPRILTANEIYSNRLRNSSKTHGLTLHASLRKMIHEANDGTLYNLVEDLCEEYIGFWKQMYIDFIKEMNSVFSINTNKVDKIESFKNLKDINGIDNDDITQLKKKVKKLFVRGDIEVVRVSGEWFSSYEKYLEKEGLGIIEYNIRKNILQYHNLAKELSGEGSSNVCRQYINEMLSVEKNVKVKDGINKQIVNVFTNINSINHSMFLKKLSTIFDIFCEQYEDGDGIDVDGINEILESMDGELYYSSDEN